MSDRSPFAVPTRFDGALDRVAIVIPGVSYSPARPLLHFARSVLLQHGWTVQELWWQIPDDFPRLPVEDRIAWVEWQVGRAIDAERGACRLLIGKSLGSLACGVAADRNLAAAWLTPVLTIDYVAHSLWRAKAPTLLVGGSADKLWDPRIAESVRHGVLEIPGADHALEIANDTAGSVEALRQVVSRLDRFIGSLEPQM
ncbi:alpha/beta hydrolase [Streptomyces litchfieldiae]|uniref:Alpha/beta hydrolase n=1 Tax=Streptomyces litchfieldiae TaxID=3075543 RepID=A0ABU2ML03_9ACTN|nr:alpha/beta hydrolase [Streptomyces sp. DSM 44938]MDT0342292.1 alpha/beta hydrolase [Streptomyces sp. DSM 44938]